MKDHELYTLCNTGQEHVQAVCGSIIPEGLEWTLLARSRIAPVA